MAINIHAGHAKIGGGAIGAVGYISESVEDRRIKNLVKKNLIKKGYRVFDCTTDKGTQSQVLSGIIKKCNSNKVSLDVSIHFNCGVSQKNSDGNTTGVEVWTTGKNKSADNIASSICKGISKLGFKNRGVKHTNGLYFLNHAKAPAILIEVCFVDDPDDVKLYKKTYKKIAKVIADSIGG